MKQRFSSLDVKVIAHELSGTLDGLRVHNCYDLSSRIFLIKFRRPGRREQLVIDSGFRCHLTSFARTTAAEPSAFVAKLRKHLSTRRITSVRQIGTDRVIEFAFSDGTYKLYLEFFAGGNIILCDKDLQVLTLLRRVPSGAGEEEIHEGMIYDLEKRQNFQGVPELSLERLRSSLQTQIEKTAKEPVTKKTKRKPGDALRRALAAAVPEFPPMLIEHSFRVRHFDGSVPPEDVLKDEDKLQRLLDVLEDAKQQSDEVIAANPSKGYIIAKPAKAKPLGDSKITDGSDADKENIALMYEDFHPFRPRQFADDPNTTIIEIIGFNKAVDDFYSSLESQKLESRLNERELAAQRKIESARLDHEKRVGGLQQVQELNVRKAQALEANLQRVEEATAAVNGLISQGMDWEDIASLIQTEKSRRNPVAMIIHLPLKLHENTVTLLLGEEEELEDDFDFADESASEESEDDAGDSKKGDTKSSAEDKKGKLLEIDVDLALTGWANAGQYYDQKKTAAIKEEKTAQASEAALKRHEKKVQSDLKKGLAQEKQALRAVRQQLWFEKFLYFISSEGYLVIGARDKSQSDILYRKHLGKGDVWVSAELSGASHIIVKNRPGLQDSPIPPSTLAQAGTFCVCSSDAWDSKAVMGAWWVKADQVSKLAPNGDYLGPALFEIKGGKNHLPPAQLLLGFGVMFRLSDASSMKRNANRVALGDVTDSKAANSNNPEDSVTEEAKLESPEESEVDDDREAENSTTYHNPLQSLSGTIEPVDVQSDDETDSRVDEESDKENGRLETLPNTTVPPAVDEEKIENEREEEDEDDGEEEEEGEEAEHASTSDQPTGTSTPNASAASKAAPHVRGKHGKKAKLKAKYAWQDDEDRTLALRFLGSSKGQEKKTADAEQKALKDVVDAEAKERRRAQHQAAQQKGKEAEEARQRRLAGEKAPGDDDEDDEAEAENLDVVAKFVGMPKPGDEIEDCLVVCGPWDSLGPRLRWRIKVQPGPLKKGKAVREMLSSWKREVGTREQKRMPPETDERWPEEAMLRREGALLKDIQEAEVINCLPVRSCRVVIGSGDPGKGGKGSAGGGRGGKSGAKGGRGGKGSKKK